MASSAARTNLWRERHTESVDEGEPPKEEDDGDEKERACDTMRRTTLGLVRGRLEGTYMAYTAKMATMIV